MAGIEELLHHMVGQRASDLHLKAGSPPFMRVNGRLHKTDFPPVSAAEAHELIDGFVPTDRAREFEEFGEADFALSISGLGRFRVSVLRQRGSIGIVLRRVLMSPPSFDSLGLPVQVRQLSERRNGLVLVTGPSDSGKSTTIATMIDHVNDHAPVSVMTIEDPIEMLFPDKKAFISQREVGTDTRDHLTALQRALRHDPDVIYLDRVPDAETMSTVMAAATSRLIFTVLPMLTVEETIAGIVDFFPPHHSRQVRHTLASVLQGVISQRLLEREDGKGRVAAFEILVSTPRIHDAIVMAPGADTVEHLIATGEYYGMQTLDQHLTSLVRNRLVSSRNALSIATHPQELRVSMQ